MNQKETAEQAWKEKAENDMGIGLIPASYLLGIDDFKASLREEIQKKIGALKTYGNIPNGWKAEGFREALQLIDTVKPKIG